MASHPESSRRQLNEDLTKQELTTALIIRNQLKAILDDSTQQLKSAKARQAVHLVHERIDEALVALLHATSRDDYRLQQSRFNALLMQFRDIMHLDGDAELALLDFRFFHHVYQTLNQATVENRGELLTRFTQKFQDDPDFDLWCRHLNALQSIPPDQFERQKNALLNGLGVETTYLELANLAAMGLVEKNAQILTNTRMIYLKETNNRKSLLKDIGWIGLGIGLVTAAAVLAIAFPVLAVPGIVVGSIVMGYGIIDFAKESVELYSELKEEEKGELSHDGEDELKHLETDIKDLDVERFLQNQPHQPEGWSAEKKWVKGLGYAASFTGFALGLVALAFVLPGIAVPAAAVIAVTAVAVGVAALAGALLGYRVYSSQKKLNETEQDVQRHRAQDVQCLDDLSAHLLSTSPSSDARINQKLQTSPQNDAASGKKIQAAPADEVVDADDEGERERQGDDERGNLTEAHDDSDADTERQDDDDGDGDGDKPVPH